MMNNKGLTLIEIIISIAILSIIALLFVSIFGTGFQHIMNAGDQSRTLIEEQKDLETLISTTGPGIQFDVDMNDLYPSIYPTPASEMIEGVTINQGDFTTYLPGVTNYVVFVTSISLSPTSYTFVEIGAIGNIYSSVLPNNASDHEVTWTSNDESIIQVQNGLLTAKAVGTTFVTAVADGSDPSGLTVSASVGITVNTGGTSLGSDSSLASLSTDSVPVPGFIGSTLDYFEEVPGNHPPTVTFTPTDPNVTYVLVQADDTRPNHGNTVASVTVTSEDGNSTTQYTITFTKK